MVGVPEIVNKTTNDEELQTAEVIQTLYTVKTSNLTHRLDTDFSKPDDMEEDFYNLGAHATHDIISYGRPDEPNFFFFDESPFDPSHPTAGHRMALLSPNVVKEDYGIGEYVIYGRSTSSRDSYDNMSNSFAAYPSPGYFPKQDFADKSDWDLFLNVNDFNGFRTLEQMKNVKITIKNLETNKVETRSYDENNIKIDTNCSSVTGRCLYIRFNILKPSNSPFLHIVLVSDISGFMVPVSSALSGLVTSSNDCINKGRPSKYPYKFLYS